MKKRILVLMLMSLLTSGCTKYDIIPEWDSETMPEVKEELIVEFEESCNTPVAEYIALKDSTGESLENARVILGEFELAVVEEYSDSVPEGVIIWQNPNDGGKRKNTMVKVGVSLGVKPELVPDDKKEPVVQNAPNSKIEPSQTVKKPVGKVEAPVKEVKSEISAPQPPKESTPKPEEKPETVAPIESEPVAVPEPVTEKTIEADKSYEFFTQVEKDILAVTNRYRNEHGLTSLKPSSTLDASARDHSRTMFMTGEFEHTEVYSVGENIYMIATGDSNKRTAEHIVRQWMDSPGHRANILNKDAVSLGAGVIFGSQYFKEHDRYLPTLYATQHFTR